MEFTEEELHEFLGTGQEEGAETPEEVDGGEPQAQSQTDAGGIAGEAAPDDGSPGVVPTGTEPEESQGGLTAASGQPPQDRSREASQDEIIKRAVETALARERQEQEARSREQWAEFFRSAGLKDSLNGGKPITSLEEFQAWKKAYDAQRLERELAEGKLTPETIRALAGQAAEERLRSVPAIDGRRAPASENMAKREVSEEQIQRELEAIHQLDGSVRSLEDIRKMDTWNAFQDAVMNRGCSFLEAFRLANFDAIMERRQKEISQRAAQAAVNNARSKEHLTVSGSRGEGAARVPDEVMEMYRYLNAGCSEADITAHYNRMLKEMKK